MAPLATAALSNRDWLSITQNLFRFTPYRQSSYLNKHSTNEQASLEDQVEMVMYYYQLMRTMNGEEVAEDEEGEKVRSFVLLLLRHRNVETRFLVGHGEHH